MSFIRFETNSTRQCALSLLLGSALALTACGGGGGGGGSAVSDASTPAPSAQSSRTLGGTATGLAANSSLVLQNNGAQTLTVSADGAFAFSGALSEGSAYNITVQTPPSGYTCSVANGSGTVGASDIRNITVSCESMAKSWRTAQPVKFDAGTFVSGANIATDSKGDAVAVWRQSKDNVFNTWSNRYSAATRRWGQPEPIGTPSSPINLPGPAIAADAAGNVAVTWLQRELTSGADHIWSNYYVAATGSWSGATRVDASLPSLISTVIRGLELRSYSPEIVLDASGIATVVWIRSDGSNYSIWSNRYIPSTGRWSTPQQVQADSPSRVITTKIAIDPSNNVVAVWDQIGGDIRASRYQASTGSWSAPIQLDAGERAFNPSIAIDRSGNAYVAWRQTDGADLDRNWSSRYDVATDRWETPKRLGSGSEVPRSQTSDPQIAVDSSGAAVAIWSYKATIEGSSQLLSSRLSAGAGSWTAPSVLDTTALLHNGYRLAADSRGNLFAIWSVSETVQRQIIQSARYSAARQSWDTPITISPDASSSVAPRLAVDGADNVVAVWLHRVPVDADLTVWSNNYR